MSLLFLSLALVLPLSALLGRRLEWKKGLVMALAWGAIFMAAATIISLLRG